MVGEIEKKPSSFFFYFMFFAIQNNMDFYNYYIFIGNMTYNHFLYP